MWEISGGGGLADEYEFLKPRKANKTLSQLMPQRKSHVPL
ncbi:hypothetical protein CES85_0424 [Ochrobactrum quorumnocens]|uniref:Uncharacterized protein n=1 Tax=Ochrobactrum quorumnocens TaxID=271865 RepID=A0A248UFU9_9HYPH|nr:hypothetical protein CES85_0424 [[Ochrobactrum] quorumnocens]